MKISIAHPKLSNPISQLDHIGPDTVGHSQTKIKGQKKKQDEEGGIQIPRVEYDF